MSFYNTIFVPQKNDGGNANAIIEDAECDPSVNVGDVVRVNSSGVIVKAQANNLTNSNAIGVCEEKTEPTICVVRLSGISKEIFSGLSESQNYFLSETTPGAVQTIAPTGSGSVVVRIGTAYGTSKILVLIGERVLRA